MHGVSAHCSYGPWSNPTVTWALCPHSTGGAWPATCQQLRQHALQLCAQHLLGLLQQQAQKSGQPRLDQKAILHTFGASRLVQAQRSTPAHWFAQRPRGSTTCDGCSPWSTNLPHGWWERRVAEHSPEFAECPGRNEAHKVLLSLVHEALPRLAQLVHASTPGKSSQI